MTVGEYAAKSDCPIYSMSHRLADIGKGRPNERLSPGSELVEGYRSLEKDPRAKTTRLTPKGMALANRVARIIEHPAAS